MTSPRFDPTEAARLARELEKDATTLKLYDEALAEVDGWKRRWNETMPKGPDIDKMLYDARALAERDALRAEVERLREALETARYPLSVAASYVDDRTISIGLRLHAESCVAALRAIDAARETEGK
jgi:hypothetical protein